MNTHSQAFMSSLYNTPQKVQAQNNRDVIGFDYNHVEKYPNELNYNEKVSLTYFDKIKLLKSIASYKLKGKGQCVITILNYLIDHSDNDTGITYHSQARMRQMTGFSKVQIIDSIKTLVEYGFLFKQRRGRRITNMYMINYDLIHDPEMKSTINRFNYKSYPRKPRRMSPILEVKSDLTLSTNTDIKEVSINTNRKESNFFDNQVSEEVLFETLDPIPLTEDLKFRLWTLADIGNKVSLSGIALDSFLEKMEAGYRYKWKDPQVRREIKWWNGDFNSYCRKEKAAMEKHGKRYIPPLVRYQHHSEVKSKTEFNVSTFKEKLAQWDLDNPEPSHSNSSVHNEWRYARSAFIKSA